MATITKRKNSYLIRVSCGYDVNGRQIVHSMTWKPEPTMTPKQVEKELQRQAVLFEDKCRTGQYLNGNIRFADFVDIWVKEYGEKQLKACTLDRYKKQFKRINQALGHIRLDKLQPIHIMRFYDNLAEENIRWDITYTPTTDIKQLIRDSGTTRKAFTENIGLSRTTINEVCTGRNVRLGTAEKIAQAFNCKVSDIFKPSTENTKLAPKTIRGYHRVISSVLKTAVQWQVIMSNPCQRVSPPKVEHKESRFLDEVESIHLLECLSNEPLQYRALITLLIYSGMRRGEICGLKWGDINFKEGIINIQREIMYLKEIGLFEDTTKTISSQRVIKMADMPLQLLQIHRREQCINRLKCGDQWQNNNYVFTQWNGAPMHPESLTTWFHKFIVKYNLPKISLHSLRHTNASLLIANGVNITTVSKRLGHANTSVTMGIYAHAIKSADEVAADTLQNIFNIK